MKIIASYIIHVVTIAIIICYGLGCIAPYISPVRFALPAYFGLAFPAVWAILVFILFLNICTRHWRSSIILILILLTTTGQWRRTIVFHSETNTDIPTNSPSVKILTFNVGIFQNQNGIDKIVDFIKDTKADIVCLQEFGFYTKNLTQQDVLKKLDAIYPHRHLWYKNQSKKIQSGLATFSKYPIVKKQKIQYKSANNVSIYSDIKIKIKNDTIRVINNHLESNHLNHSERNISALLDDGTSREEIVQHSQKLQNKLGSALKIRALQAEAIRYTISQSPHKVIVAGDFNDVPQSYTYRIISTGLKDVYTTIGKWGYYWTFHESMMYFPIDHILISPSLIPTNAEIIKTNLSDHYPIVANICIPKKLEN